MGRASSEPDESIGRAQFRRKQADGRGKNLDREMKKERGRERETERE